MAETQPARVGISTSDLKNIASFEDAVALLQQTFGTDVASSVELGDGFTLWNTSMDDLIGVPMLLVSHVEATSDKFYDDNGDFAKFSVVRFLMQHRDGTTGKWILTDGSTGIHRQLTEYIATNGGVFPGMTVANGLRKSTYDTVNEAGKPIVATTYYLDTSPAIRG